jgi:hypothetical protein
MTLHFTPSTNSAPPGGVYLSVAMPEVRLENPLELLLARAEEAARTTEERWPGHRFGLRMVHRMHEMPRETEKIAARNGIPEHLQPLLRICLAGSCVGRIQEGALDLDTLRELPSLGEITVSALEAWGVFDRLPAEDGRIVREVLGATNRFTGDLSLANPSFRLWKAVKDEARERILADESLVMAEGILQQIEIHFLCRVISEREMLTLRAPEGIRRAIIAGIQSVLDGTSSNQAPLSALQGDPEAQQVYHRVRNYLCSLVDEKALQAFESHKTPSPVTGKRSFGTFLLQYLSFPFETIRDDSAAAVSKSQGFSDRIRLLGRIAGEETQVRVLSALNQHLSGRGAGYWLAMPR